MEFIPIKKENEKRNKKVKLSTKDIIIKPELSNLYKSIDTNVSTLHQVNKLLETGTNEVKSILSYECNVIYECRTCRTLYRSVINFISHKEKYCRKKFDTSLDENDLTGNSKTDGIKNDKIFQSFHALEEYPQNKDLNKVNKKQENTNFVNDINIENELPNTSNEQHVYLDTNCSAAYQSVKSNVIDTADLKEQITELQNMINVRTIILEEQMSENQFEKSDSPIQMNMSDEENKILMPKSSAKNLTCIMCGAIFSTKKTLNVHIKTVHAIQRIYYSCPCCMNTFANIWSVYRHLNKVHKKSYKQARKLRPQIMKKMSRKASVKNIGNAIKTSASKTIAMTYNKNQKSMDHVESSKKFQNYNRYKKKLDTKPLSVYSQFCEMPINICNETKINIEHSNKALTDITPINNLPIYEIDNVDTITNQNMIAKVFSKQDAISEQSSSLSETYKHHETSIHIEDVSNLTNEYWDKRKRENNYPSISNLTNYKNDFRPSVPLQNIDKNESLPINENQDHFVPDENTIWLKTDELKRLAPKLRYKKKLSYNIKNSLTNSKEKDVVNMQEDKFRLQPLLLAQSKEKDQTLLIESQIAAIANFQKLQCLICKRKLKSISNLRRHIATNHINWNRYRCKLCDFKCFTKCDCVAHCNKVHNAQNNHMILTELVIKIPHNEYTCNENIMSLTSTKEKLSSTTMNIISLNQSEISLDSNLCNSNGHVVSQVENTIINEQINEYAESYKDVEHSNMKNDNSINNNRNNITMENLLDYLMNYKKTSKSLDTNPVLKKIVMEIILGSNNTNTTKQIDEAAKSNSDTNINADVKNDEKNISDSKSYSFTNNMTYKRPKRNRIKPLNADFVYGTLCTF